MKNKKREASPEEAIIHFMQENLRFPTQNDCPKVDYLLSQRAYLKIFGSWKKLREHTIRVLTQNYVEVKQNYVEVKQNDVEVKQNDVEVKQNDVTVKQNDVTVKQNDVEVKQNDVTVKQNDVEVEQNDVEVEQNYDEVEQNYVMDETSLTDDLTLTIEEAKKNKEYVNFEYYERIPLEVRKDFLDSIDVVTYYDTDVRMKFDQYIYEAYYNNPI